MAIFITPQPRRRRLPGLIVPVLLTCFGLLHAGVTGTLAGYVYDAETEQAMPGVNVFLPGTHLGAVTDTRGLYMITNIPAGTYKAKATFIGYQAMTKTEVVILPDLRTKIDFNLTPSAIEMDEVVVTAEAPLIRKDITATTHFVSAQEIEYLPVQSFYDIVDLQPGVAAGHIRGGRKTEVLYLVDGLPIQDAIEGKAGSDLPNSSIIEMTVQTGGFNAEYGNAMSGVVNVITKEGTDHLKARGEIELLHLQNNPLPFDTVRNPMDYFGEFNIGGSVIPGRLKYYLAANFIAPYSRWKDEQFGNRMVVLASDKSSNYNVNSKITIYPIPAFKLTVQGLLSIWSWHEYDHKWKYHLDGLPARSKKSYRISLTGAHSISPRTFYEIRLSRYNVLKSILGKSFREVPNLTFFDWNNDGVEDLNDWPGFVKTGELPWWMDHQVAHNIFKADFTSQINEHHQLKTGIYLTYYQLYKNNVQAMYLRTYDPNFPFFITYHTEYEYDPWQGSWYFQDKIDYEGMVANIGLRYDHFDPRAARPALEEQIVGDRSEWIIDYDETIPARPKHQISPRLGVALPVTATDVLHVNYGFFFQMPAFDYLYTNSNLNTAVGFSPLGDPDLKPAKTIMWEVSYKGQITPTTMFDATIFNKDVSNLIDANTFKNQQKGDIYRSAGFTRFVNLASVNVRGFEFYLKRVYSQTISGKLSYTYMIAKGTGSTEFEKFVWTEKNYQVPVDQYYLSWDQRHTFVLNVDIRKPDWGGLNILWRWNSPLPYTHNEGPTTTPNNRRMDPTTTLDLRFNRRITIGGITGYVYAEVLNTTDQLNVLWVDDEGLTGGILGDPGAMDMSCRIRLGMGFDF